MKIAFKLALCLVMLFQFSERSTAQEFLKPQSHFGVMGMGAVQSTTFGTQEILSKNGFEDYDRFSTYDRYKHFPKMIGALDSLLRNGEVSGCTANLIAPDLIITAAHCAMTNGPKSAEKMVFQLGFTQETSKIEKINVHVRAVEHNVKLDFAIYRLKRSIPTKALNSINFAEPVKNMPLVVAGHPHSAVLQISRINCFAKKIQTGRAKRIQHECPTAGGSSGAFLFSDAEPTKIVALHSAALLGVNIAVPIRDILEASPTLRRALSARKRPINSRALENNTNDTTSLTSLDIRSAQLNLNKLGYDSGPADGQIGPRTRAALKQFQKAFGLSATGQLTSETRIALSSTGDVQPAKPPAPSHKNMNDDSKATTQWNKSSRGVFVSPTRAVIGYCNGLDIFGKPRTVSNFMPKVGGRVSHQERTRIDKMTAQLKSEIDLDSQDHSSVVTGIFGEFRGTCVQVADPIFATLKQFQISYIRESRSESSGGVSGTSPEPSHAGSLTIDAQNGVSAERGLLTKTDP